MRLFFGERRHVPRIPRDPAPCSRAISLFSTGKAKEGGGKAKDFMWLVVSAR